MPSSPPRTASGRPPAVPSLARELSLRELSREPAVSEIMLREGSQSARPWKASSNKIQGRTLSSEGYFNGHASAREEKRQEAEARMVRELSRDIQDKICGHVRAAIREELQDPGGVRAAIREELQVLLAPCLEGRAAQCRPSESEEAPALVGRMHSKDMVDRMRSKDMVDMISHGYEARSMNLVMLAEENKNKNTRRLSEVEAEKAKAQLPSALINYNVDNVVDEFAKSFPLGRSCVDRCCRLVSWLQSLEEPPRTGCAARLVHGYAFEVFSVTGIVLNCVYMTYAANYEAANYWRSGTSNWLNMGEAFFLCWFGFELGLKVYVHRAYFFVSERWKMRLLDTVLVAFQFWSVLGDFGVFPSSQTNMSFMRAIRTLRLLRVIRALKAMNEFKQLHAILAAIQTSLITLLWCMIMVTGIMWMFSLLFVQRTTAHLVSLYELGGDQSTAESSDALISFANVESSMIGLFMAVSGGSDWQIQYNALEATGTENQVLYLVFIAFMHFAVLNIVTGIFVETAMKQMEQQDSSDRATLFLKKRLEQEQGLMAICTRADENGNGYISEEEFRRAMQEGQMTAYLDTLGFQHQDILDFFHALASTSDDKHVDVDVFVRGCIQLAGGATRFDMKTMIIEIQELRGEMAAMLRARRAQAEPPQADAPAEEPRARTPPGTPRRRTPPNSARVLEVL